jgi:hypothetical protein
MKRVIESFVTVIALGLVLALAGCGTGDTGPAGAAGAAGEQGTPGASGVVTNATCLAANCHGNASLVKTIVRNDAGKEGVVETIPLYVDNALFNATVHGGQRCVGCHSDINAAGGAHGPVVKTYGGWARFSAKQAVETIATNEFLRTRNYFTAASRSCVTCHSNHADFVNSAHATIYKQRSARVDTALREAVRVAYGDAAIVGEDFGENYTAGDCNRCHASCATCHFKSTVKRALAVDPLIFWDNNMAGISSPGWADTGTEFEMDWTTNVASHEFRNGSYFLNDTDKVCEACHTGLYKKAKTAYYWADAAKTSVKSVKATNVKRHTQTYELSISGNPTVLTGGNNTAHAAMTCAECHGGTVGDLHGLPGLPYEWDAPTYPRGDVHCTDCHSGTHTNGAVGFHIDGSGIYGIKVACVGCHAFGLARDFMFASGAPVDNSTDVFLDPETNEVRPVVYKHTFAEAWYPHNWQTLNPGTGFTDPAGDCAKKCHYSGNAVGAIVLP